MTCARRIGIIVNDLRAQNRAAEVNNFHLHNVNVVFGKKNQSSNNKSLSNLEPSVCMGNIKPRRWRIDLSIARSIQQGPSLMFPVQTFISINK